VVTNLGLLEPSPQGELILTALHPGATLEQARANTGWDLQTAQALQVTEPPSPEELQILRRELDPEGIYLKS
jgi:glutaconate CoA-transferase subunit B